MTVVHFPLNIRDYLKCETSKLKNPSVPGLQTVGNIQFPNFEHRSIYSM